jgi:hypothetical protein
MSMIGRLRTLSREEKAEADKDSSLYEKMISDTLSISTDNWWDQLWFIYHIWMKNNNIADVPNPSCQRNKEKDYEVGDDLGYGKPLYLTPEQATKVYDFLATVDPEQLVQHALTQEFDDMLYPHDWPEEFQKGHDWILGYMNTLKEYYKKAVDASAGMLQAIV